MGSWHYFEIFWDVLTLELDMFGIRVLYLEMIYNIAFKEGWMIF
jgi:hypothetical protein